MNRLWVPGQGMELHDEYPIPPPQELVAHWEEYAKGNVVEAPGVYGALRLPDSPPQGYASIDVCEVLRETHRGLRKVAEVREGTYSGNMHLYGDGTVITSSEDITSVLQVLMTNALIEPVAGIEEIGKVMRGWRQNGVYVIANTSTLPGCERGTINFFATYLPEAFDGILLPRNHDGTLPITKGHAAASVIQAFSPLASGIAAIHIDDSPHHNAAFRHQVSTFSGVHVATFQPEYPSHLPPDKGSTITQTPLAAFQAADQFFKAHLTS